MPQKRLLRELREALAKLVEEFGSISERRRLALTLIAALRLRQRGEPVTPRSVAKEAQDIIKRTKGRIDWGIDSKDYTAAIAVDLLHELIEMGVLEPDPEILGELDRRYRFRSYEEEEDAAKEALHAVAPLLLRIV